MTGVAAAAVLVPAHAQPSDAERTEVLVISTSAISSVTESVVTVQIPLPESVGPHPSACDHLSYLRYRRR
ncbi:hypothetical protein ACIHDR_13650 [Nocardia sp. NPDC052278]|uniref:hypothetical protein n=1 Tax=unclassified Nocardia TaxID=2637762 RepID=UPI003685121A